LYAQIHFSTRPLVSFLVSAHDIRLRFSFEKIYSYTAFPIFHFPFLILVFGTLYFTVRINDKTAFPVCLKRRPILETSNIYPRRQLQKEGVAFTDLLRNKPTITKKSLTGKWMHCTNSQCEKILIARQKRKSISRLISRRFS